MSWLQFIARLLPFLVSLTSAMPNALAGRASELDGGFGETAQQMSTQTTCMSSPKASWGSTWATTVPVIDSCGAASSSEDMIVCPGAGPGGYYYRCCSSAGHCGPKNPLQEQGLYCGAGCQGARARGGGNGSGSSDDGIRNNRDSKRRSSTPVRGCGGLMPVPTYGIDVPTAPSALAPAGATCGPIPNRRCGPGLCCSGSNYCGTGPEFCGAANWCQADYGICHG